LLNDCTFRNYNFEILSQWVVEKDSPS